MLGKLKLLLIAMVLQLAVLGSQAKAQDYGLVFEGFTSSGLTFDEKRYLQTALAFEGQYAGLLDGDWGRLSREAMQRYSKAEFGTASEEWHMAFLALSFYERHQRDGWNMRFFPSLGMSLMLPQQTLIVDPATDLFINFRHATTSLSVSIGIHDQRTATSLHAFTTESHSSRLKPYLVRKTNFAVSSATLGDGSRLYTRSEFINGLWSTVMVSADRADRNTFQAVTSSITKGRSPGIDISRGGKLIDVVRKTIAIANSKDTAPLGREPDVPANSARSSGSGFVVSVDGHILTNAHVVDGCTTIYVDGAKAHVVDASDIFDLALLKTTLSEEKRVAVFAASPVKLNSDVTVVGFPYAGLLGGINVTRGAVSSLKGLGGDSTTLQITAPIQSGNSGGPLLAADGEVIGVVVSKLDALVVAQASGDVPQNVNFAIRGEIAKLFLAQNSIDPRLSLDDEVISPEQLAQTASKFTSFIECR